MRELERDLPATAGASAGVAALPRIAIVGRGRLGGALARAAEARGLDFVTAGRGDLPHALSGARVALLCVPDAAIRSSCERVCAVAGDRLALVGHTSGATGLDALAAAAERGASVFSLHPLQTIPDGYADVTAAPCAVSGSDAGATAKATALAAAMGMRPFEVPEDSRAAYHAAASMASNFLVTLQESAADLLGEAGIDDARELLAPLVLHTATNWSERGSEALTGPIARGDEATVALHVEALRETAPHLVGLYEELAARTRELAGRS